MDGVIASWPHIGQWSKVPKQVDSGRFTMIRAKAQNGEDPMRMLRNKGTISSS